MELSVLNIYKSNQMENLAAALEDVVKLPVSDPMQAEWIGVQSKGMKQWITLNMAQRFGVCANFKFGFPRQMVAHIIQSTAPLNGEKLIIDQEQDLIFWAILSQMNTLDDPKALESVFDYIQADTTGKKKLQLAQRLANVFDLYQTFRPDMLADWDTDRAGEWLKDPLARWQARLWERVRPEKDHCLYENIQGFLNRLSPNNQSDNQLDSQRRRPEGNKRFIGLPDRMSLFGISSLAPMFLQVFDRISQFMDVHLFLLVPTGHYFFDIQSMRQINKIAAQSGNGTSVDDLYYETGNPLLSALGTNIQSFCAILETFDYSEPLGDLFADPVQEKTSMLTQLQSDVLNLVHRCPGTDNEPIPILENDRSVQIHACHSPMRETQVLKDLILDEFDQYPDLFPHDIIVMMPDIETYAPFIESVFRQEHALPYTISDRRKKSESPVLDTFLKILALKNSRFEKTGVLDLLRCELISEKFNIPLNEMALIEKMADDAVILWGKNSSHRQSMDLPPFEENTWENGFARLFMGMAMPEFSDELVQGILPCQSVEGLELAVLGKFADFYHTLSGILSEFDSDQTSGHTPSHTIDIWCVKLKKMIRSLMSQNDSNSEDFIFLYETIDQIQVQAFQAGFTQLLSFEALYALLEQKLDLSIAQGNFMAGRITFCNIMPMRSIPFKVVVLMGMDEKSFPRRVPAAGFDLTQKYPRPGDKNARDEDRYLFLESLLSARSSFIITYTGMSIKDNSLIPCSGVVSELVETMEQSFVFPDSLQVSHVHALHPFDPVYFSGSRALGRAGHSYSADNLCIAQSLSGKRPDPAAFVTAGANVHKENPEIDQVGLEEVVQFYKNPLKTWVRQGLNLDIPVLPEDRMDRENFVLNGLDQYKLGDLLLDKLSDLDADIDLYPVLKAGGNLPLGEKGRAEFDRIQNLAAPILKVRQKLVSSPKLPDLAGQVQVDSTLVSAGLTGIHQQGRQCFTYGRINGARLVSAWIEHLFLVLASSDDYPKTTFLTGRDPSNKRPVITYGFNDPGPEAEFMFKQLIQLFASGHEKPVFLFCETGFAFAKALIKEGFDTSWETLNRIMSQYKIKAAWQGNQFVSGESQDRYVDLCIGNNDLFRNPDTLLASGFVRNLEIVYQPLLNHLEVES